MDTTITSVVNTPSDQIVSKFNETFGYVSNTANYTLTNSDVLVDCTANSFSTTLPTAVGITGKRFYIKNSGVGVITVNTTSSQTIDGALTQTLNQYEALTVVSTGSVWIII